MYDTYKHTKYHSCVFIILEWTIYVCQWLTLPCWYHHIVQSTLCTHTDFCCLYRLLCSPDLYYNMYKVLFPWLYQGISVAAEDLAFIHLKGTCSEFALIAVCTFYSVLKIKIQSHCSVNQVWSVICCLPYKCYNMLLCLIGWVVMVWSLTECSRHWSKMTHYPPVRSSIQMTL